jgi:hypothetical protein
MSSRSAVRLIDRPPLENSHACPFESAKSPRSVSAFAFCGALTAAVIMAPKIRPAPAARTKTLILSDVAGAKRIRAMPNGIVSMIMIRCRKSHLQPARAA